MPMPTTCRAAHWLKTQHCPDATLAIGAGIRAVQDDLPPDLQPRRPTSRSTARSSTTCSPTATRSLSASCRARDRGARPYQRQHRLPDRRRAVHRRFAVHARRRHRALRFPRRRRGHAVSLDPAPVRTARRHPRVRLPRLRPRRARGRLRNHASANRSAPTSMSATASAKPNSCALREARDATLAMPALILPAVQVNIRAGALPERRGQWRALPQDPLTSCRTPLGAIAIVRHRAHGAPQSILDDHADSAVRPAASAVACAASGRRMPRPNRGSGDIATARTIRACMLAAGSPPIAARVPPTAGRAAARNRDRRPRTARRCTAKAFRWSRCCAHAGAMPAEPLRGAQLARSCGSTRATATARCSRWPNSIRPSAAAPCSWSIAATASRWTPTIGPLRLLVPDDARPARWVRQLESITVIVAP